MYEKLMTIFVQFVDQLSGNNEEEEEILVDVVKGLSDLASHGN